MDILLTSSCSIPVGPGFPSDMHCLGMSTVKDIQHSLTTHIHPSVPTSNVHTYNITAIIVKAANLIGLNFSGCT